MTISESIFGFLFLTVLVFCVGVFFYFKGRLDEKEKVFEGARHKSGAFINLDDVVIAINVDLHDGQRISAGHKIKFSVIADECVNEYLDQQGLIAQPKGIEFLSANRNRKQ